MKKLIKGRIIGVLLIAAFILGSAAVLGFTMSAAQGNIDKEVVTSQSVVNDPDVKYGTPDFQVNENGQTYGSGLHPAYDTIEKPDLIQAIGIDGTEGYVLRTDFEGTGPLDRPQNEEEALVYMEQLNELIRQAQERGDEYVYTIPLYDSDGVTVIGEFGVSIPIRHE